MRTAKKICEGGKGEDVSYVCLCVGAHGGSGLGWSVNVVCDAMQCDGSGWERKKRKTGENEPGGHEGRY